MSRKTTFIVSLALSLVVLTGWTATAKVGKSSRPTPRPSTPARLKPNSRGRTPLDRILMPYLQQHLPAGASHSKFAVTPNAVPASSSVAPPNFGGYVDAPFYPGRLESSCVTDPYNCGVMDEVSADFDKDGKPDVGVLQADGTLNILLNDGHGGLKTPVSYANPNYTSTFIQQAFAVDLNGDGYADVLAFDDSNNALIFYLNQKNGTFATAQTIDLVYDFGNVNCIALADVNADGKLDVVTIATNLTSVSSTDVTIQTLLGKGDGTFAVAGKSLTETVTVASQVETPGNYAITLGDLNGDGKLDLAAVFEEYDSMNTGKLVASIALGNGDGTFGALNSDNPFSINLSSPTRLFIDSAGVQILDLNHDSKPDLAVDAQGTLFVLLGDGSAGFTSTVTTQAGGSDQILYQDVNGDGVPDLIQESGMLNVWFGKGDGTFNPPSDGYAYVVDGGTGQGMNLADFNGDGHMDIAQLGGDYKQVSIFSGDGKGAFHGANVLNTTTDPNSNPFFLYFEDAADILGNGLTDTLFIDINNIAAPYILAGISDGKGNFNYTPALPSSAVPDIAFLQPVQADFNGDGKQDLLIAGGRGDLYVALSKGDGTFLAPKALALPSINCELSYAATADLNGDGHTDVVVAYPGDTACGGSGSTPSGFFVALGKGDGTFSTATFTGYGSELYSVTIADMNSDGIPDLLLDDVPTNVPGDFAVGLLPGNGDGTFQPGSSVNTDYIVSQVIAGDYNQDGKPDLILLSEGEETDQDAEKTAGILLLPGHGDGTFGDFSQLATGNFFLNGTLTDVNGDGLPDLVAALYLTVGQPNTYYGLSTLLNEGGGAFSPPVNVLESLESAVPFAGNFYADNAPDVVVSTAYGTALFLGQGGTTLKLATSASSLSFGDSETLTANLAASMPGRPAPTGTVSFYDGTTLLANAEISGGTATFATSALATGAHSITAAYSGDANFNPHTSAAQAVHVTTLAPAFTVASNPTSLNLTRGQNAVVTLTLAANAAFSGTVSLACTGLPADSTCIVNPSSIALTAGGSTTASLLVGTTTGKSANRMSPLWPGSAGMLSLAAVFCFFRGRRSIPRAFSVLALMALALTGIALTGCGGSSVPTAAKGSYTVKVTATPSGSGASAQTTSITVNIQ